jgi:hypothetical protein
VVDRIKSSSLSVIVFSLFIALLPASARVAFPQSSASGSTALSPGGFVEMSSSGDIRPRLSAAQIQALLPQRGIFTFPAPWLTEGVRVTNASDCAGGGDCVNYAGYSYWRNINNHVGSDTLLIFLGLNPARGGGGPTLFSYNKVTDAMANLGPLFPSTSRFGSATAEGWYWSATRPTTIYLNDGAKMLRYDVSSRQFSTVFDAEPQYGSDKFIWQLHSSDDDRVHSATLMQISTSKMLGCLVYREDTSQFSYFPEVGSFDECHVDKSGRWLVILDNVDGLYGLDNRIIDLQTGVETLLLDQNGGLGHLDTGHGYMVGEDDWSSLPGTVRTWKFGQPLVPGPTQGTIVYHTTDWNVGAGHIAHGNAVPGVPPEQQYSCSSTASRLDLPRSNEIVCYRLDGSQEVLVVAPVMTDLNATGGFDDYGKSPKGNLDVTGEYFIWTTNLGGGRLDAFLVKVPSQLLVTAPADVTPPAVSITSPPAGAMVTGAVTVSATATDDVGVAGVQFQIDGAAIAPEVIVAPYSVTWKTSAASLGPHLLTAVARDAAGNTAVSAAVSVTVASDVTPPVISGILSSAVTTSGVTVSWGTSEPGDSQVDYGTTPAYGGTTTLDVRMVSSHSQSLSALLGGTVYHYRVRSRDAAGNLALSGDMTFTTATPGTGGGIDPGRVLQWKLDETSGTLASDASGNGLTGTLVNGPRWTAGRLGGALAFDGVNDYLDTSHRAALDAYPFSVALWVKTVATGTKGILSKFAAGSNNGYQVFIKNGNVCASYMRSATRYVGSGSGCGISAGAYNDNAWHHVVFTVDASGGKLYVDGLLRASRGWVGLPGPPTSTEAVRLGRHPSSPEPYLPGLLDDVRVYSRVLAPSEIDALFAAVPSPAQGGTAVLQSVIWSNVVNCQVAGSSLQKVSGYDGVDDAGGTSQQQIAAGDGYAEFEAAEVNTLRAAGLSHGSAGTAYAEIDFGIRLQSGVAEILENGVYRTETPFLAGDVFRVAVESGVVKYFKNGSVFYVSSGTPLYPLLLDASIASLNGTIANAVISTIP